MTWVKGSKIETLDEEVIECSALGEALLTVFEERRRAQEKLAYFRGLCKKEFIL